MRAQLFHHAPDLPEQSGGRCGCDGRSFVLQIIQLVLLDIGQPVSSEHGKVVQCDKHALYGRDWLNYTGKKLL